jgi:hypothetical protein
MTIHFSITTPKEMLGRAVEFFRGFGGLAAIGVACFSLLDLYLIGKIDQAVEIFTQLSTPKSERVGRGQHFDMLMDVTGNMLIFCGEGSRPPR